MGSFLHLTTILFVLASLCYAAPEKSRVLVLIDDPKIEQTHSIYLKALKDRGYTLNIKKADDASLVLIKFGEFVYDHVIVLAPKVEEFGGSLSPSELAKFVDGGGNVLVAGDSKIGSALKDFALEVGFEYGTEGTAVIDHFNYDARMDDGTHTTLVVPKTQLTDAELISGKKLNPLLYKGIALTYNKENALRLPVLTGTLTSYNFNPKQNINEFPEAIGQNAVLVGAIQARNNARVILTGSLALFSDAFINAQIQKNGASQKAEKSGNGEFVEAITKWVLKEKGVLRVKSVKHSKVGESSPPREYTITDDVKYEIEIEELKEGKWVPFQAKDVQLAFIRIDPFVITTLNNKNGKFSTEFKIPDVYGVFKFAVDYRRVGYTHLFDVQQVLVRPFEHTQYERFLPVAYPYYVSSFSMMLGVVLFSFVFLYHKEKPVEAPVDTKKAK
ncbi:unnamed protein product [Bursaphelenchus okinawaensis]|uniref:Dolichyl-diphosphooligosaccharide--protein glycosyltransferase 48 kDa subunit n=1 Tax=Bursaphelenchus okinawaensis TaxID=465554 RepID=A0A811KBL4_9BILA|nr:unnamed protein product [Bursaphelenchus okinawaensis]CAG9095552.1 unnamed protein product [Bursaphelenchus okinawaensis]